MVFRFVILGFILAFNAFFAAAEVSLIAARKSKLRALASRGVAGAVAAQNLLSEPARLLSVTQVGVTLASLGLGWAGEDAVYNVIAMAIHPWAAVGARPWLHGVGFASAFLLISYAHALLGEVVPKNLALDKADRLALLVAPPLLLFRRMTAPLLVALERTSEEISRWLGARGGHAGGHSAEELKFLVSLSRREGHLRQFEEDAIGNMLELSNYYAREIMVPRNAVVSVAIGSDLDEVLDLLRRVKHTRIPVYEGEPEHIIGYFHSKDLLRVWQERRAANLRRKPVRPFHLRSLLRKPLVAPETKPLNELIDLFRSSHVHLAIVVDEFGTIVGIVTLEDVLEQIFGEIGDEYDAKAPPQMAEAREIEVDGATLIRDLDNQYGIELPAEAGFETLAGFMLFRLGFIPKGGETVSWGGRRFTVVEVERNRILKVRIEREEKVGGSWAG
jgi:putative hemolysin